MQKKAKKKFVRNKTTSVLSYKDQQRKKGKKIGVKKVLPIIIFLFLLGKWTKEGSV